MVERTCKHFSLMLLQLLASMLGEHCDSENNAIAQRKYKLESVILNLLLKSK